MPLVPPPLPCSISGLCQKPSINRQVSVDQVTKEIFLFMKRRQRESLPRCGTREHFDLRLSASHLTHLDLTLLGLEPRNQAGEVSPCTHHQGYLGQFISQLKECKCDRCSFQVSLPSPPHTHPYSPTKPSWIGRSLLGLSLGMATAPVV